MGLNTAFEKFNMKSRGLKWEKGGHCTRDKSLPKKKGFQSKHGKKGRIK